MKILIDTDRKTIKLEESVEFKKLAEFVKDNNLEDYTLLPDVITVKEKEWYPVYPRQPVDPLYPPTLPYIWCGSRTSNGGFSDSSTSKQMMDI